MTNKTFNKVKRIAACISAAIIFLIGMINISNFILGSILILIGTITFVLNVDEYTVFKKVIEKKIDDVASDLVCPNCEETVVPIMHFPHCASCGQELYWEVLK